MSIFLVGKLSAMIIISIIEKRALSMKRLSWIFPFDALY